MWSLNDEALYYGSYFTNGVTSTTFPLVYCLVKLGRKFTCAPFSQAPVVLQTRGNTAYYVVICQVLCRDGGVPNEHPTRRSFSCIVDTAVIY